jgi:hypothetical protein
MARDGSKTGGRNFTKGQVANPGGFTKEQAKVRHMTREELKDLLNTLHTATHEDMERILGKPETTAMTMMVVKCYMTIIETGDIRQLDVLLDRLVGKVKDELDINLKPQVIRRRNGEEIVMGMGRRKEGKE